MAHSKKLWQAGIESIKKVEDTTDWELLDDQTQEDLCTWFNCEPDDADKVRLALLFVENRFEVWECPDCAERCFLGDPDDWSYFQGVCQVDYVSYPGNKDKYQPHYILKQCDECRGAPYYG